MKSEDIRKELVSRVRDAYLTGSGDLEFKVKVAVSDPAGWPLFLKKLDEEWPEERPAPINVIFNYPATIVFWGDGDKTVVKCAEGDVYSEYAGLAIAMLKKYTSGDNVLNRAAKRWIGRK